MAFLVLALVIGLQPNCGRATPAFEPRVAAWFKGSYPHYPPEDIDFSRPGGVSHLVIGGLSLQKNGTVEPCDLTGSKAAELAKKSNAKVQLMFPTDLLSQLVIPSNASHPNTIRKNFMASIKGGLDACGANGFEIDWEGPGTQEEANNLLEWLIETRHLLGSSRYALSFDTEPPQWLPGDYFKPQPKIFFEKDNFGNESAGTGGNFDKNAAELFINFMTYFKAPDGAHAIDDYITSAQSPVSQGYPKSVVGIAIPYYEQSEGENEWTLVCPTCPNLAYEENFCKAAGSKSEDPGPNIVGKKANHDIGKLVKSMGLGGVFPWMLDYDVSPKDNNTCGDNSLFKWLKRGLIEGGTLRADETLVV